VLLQRINHFYGMLELCRKKAMAVHVSAMAAVAPQHYNFAPLSFSLPAQLPDLLADAKARGKKQVYIIKPDAGCQV
jgi:tubulin polyglutamylase TTLL6/13